MRRRNHRRRVFADTGDGLFDGCLASTDRFDLTNDCRSDNHAVGDIAQDVDLFRMTDAEPNREGQIGLTSQP